MSDVKQLPAAFGAMTTELAVTMDDVVSAFVSEYENNLFARKKELTKTIKVTEEGKAQVVKKVLAAVSGDRFEKDIPVYDLVAKVSEKTVDWCDDGVSYVNFDIVIKATKKRDGYSYNNKIDIVRKRRVPERFVTEYFDLKSQLKPLRIELAEVLDNIKSITRKERQVRGRIAVRKLEDAGYSNLMQDPELKQLVQL